MLSCVVLRCSDDDDNDSSQSSAEEVDQANCLLALGEVRKVVAPGVFQALTSTMTIETLRIVIGSVVCQFRATRLVAAMLDDEAIVARLPVSRCFFFAE